jgi:hypothetical protein
VTEGHRSSISKRRENDSNDSWARKKAWRQEDGNVLDVPKRHGEGTRDEAGQEAIMATPAFSPMPGEAAEQKPAGPETLVGPEQQEQSKAENDQEKQNRNFTAAIRSLHGDLDNLARQYPEIAKAAKQCKELLTDAMVKKMSTQQGGSNRSTPQMLAT